MSGHVSRVLQAMDEKHFMSPSDLALKTGLSEEQCKEVLRVLERGGMIEADKDRFKRARRFMSKQKRLIA